jgi:nucleotide-binding universal stress UspA family protein
VSDSNRHAESYRKVRAEELRSFLDSIFLPENARKRIVPLIEHGSPQQLVREYVHMHGADLVVLGTHGRGAVAEAILGSTAKGILASLPCDALIVSGPPQ